MKENKLYLYHYRPLKNLEHLSQLQNYLEDKIWFTRVNELNDPFEGCAIFERLLPKEILGSEHEFEEYFQFQKSIYPNITREDVYHQLNSGCSIYMLPSLPDKFDGKYENTFIFEKNTSKFFYVKNNSFEEIKDINDIQKFKKKLRDFMGNSQFVQLTNEQVNDLMLYMGDYVKNFFETTGVICFTIDESNIPMWAHYANNHQGYCVVFELDIDKIYENCQKYYPNRHDFDKFIMNVINPGSHESQEILPFKQILDEDKEFCFFKIFYRKDRPRINQSAVRQLKNADSYAITKYLIKNSIGVKYYQWEYEKEYRLISNGNSKNCGLMPLKGYCNFLRVTGIIMGKNFGKNLDKDIIDFIGSVELHDKKIGNEFEEKLKNFISELGKRDDKKIYISTPSNEVYQIYIKEYKPDLSIELCNAVVNERVVDEIIL